MDGGESRMKVLISDHLSEVGVQLLEETPEIAVDVKTGLEPEALQAIIGAYEGLVIRGATRVTAEVIAAAAQLKVIGRAGVGLDNIDIPAASKRGIVVMNTPEGNTITTAEHAVAMLLALSRNIPQGTASLREGRWEKQALEGREVFNKVLGVVGIGNIGRIVADRARGLKMQVIVYDPYIPPETVEKLGHEPVSFDELLERADYVTIHTPRTEETTNLFNRETFSRMKAGAMLVHCARGGIVNEEDLYEALHSGRLAGAALDVYTREPPGKSPLFSLPNLICTPHLGAATREAQDNVAREVAEQVAAYLLHGTVRNAVNVPSIEAELMGTLRPYALLAEKIGLLQIQLADGAVREIEVNYRGGVSEYDTTPLTSALLKGILAPILGEDVNFVNAPYIAADRGIRVVESRTATSDDFASLIKVRVTSLEEENIVSGTIFGKTRPRILRINSFYLEAMPEGHLLFIHSLDVPGVIGRIASSLGARGVNIGRMHVGQQRDQEQNVILLSTDAPVDDRVLDEIRGFEQVFSVRPIEL